MCPSTEATDAQREFAAEVLRNLLRHIDDQNGKARDQFLVSHAWTDGPMMYLVYTAPPADNTLGLVRDTRESNISPGPWLSLDEAVVYYYITDLEEGGAPFGDSPETIAWYGDRQAGLPERPSDIPAAYRYTPSPEAPSPECSRKPDPPVINEPRRYADPF
ncbi:hypothetical protein [Mycobacterium sp.]|uniref:hypothetical protein n=1 Tax=Mycobacterium sp. TaxID=1785 RepID=UPI003F9E1085